MSMEFDFTDPDHFCAGTVGPKGQRVFYLQAREAGEVVSLKLEKQQVTALADYLERLLEDLPEMRAPRGDAPILLEPVHAAFALVVDDPEARFHLSRPQVLSFIEQARVLVAAGRPPCPYCARPLDPVSGFCPCVN